MDEVLKNADSKNNLRFRIKLAERTAEARIAQEDAELAELMGA